MRHLTSGAWTTVGLAVFAVVNAILYSSLLPLWEGWDEPFHYGYVQSLSQHGQLPRFGRALLSREVERSLYLTPGGPVIQRYLPFTRTYDDYAQMPPPERRAIRARLEHLPPQLAREEAPQTPNYEAQQAPLGYLPLAAADWMAASLPLLRRVLLLRTASALAAVALQFWAFSRLSDSLRLSEPARNLALFWILCLQVFYAAVSRLGNDWLALPLVTFAIAALVDFEARAGTREQVRLGAAVGLGLLAKAYFLPFAAAAFILVLFKRRGWTTVLLVALLAAPWYLRNLALYGNLSGMQQAGAVSLSQLAAAFTSISWWRAIPDMARAALWTGNSSFNTFSANTLNCLLLLLAIALAAWAVRKPSRAEWVAFGASATFFAALVYAAVVFYAFTANGEFTLTPWYCQAIAPAIAALAVSGFSRLPRGRLPAALLSFGLAYLIAATYWLKLIPAYSGFGSASARPLELARWYAQDPAGWKTVLADTAPGPVWAIVPLAVLCACMAPWLALRVSRPKEAA